MSLYDLQMYTQNDNFKCCRYSIMATGKILKFYIVRFQWQTYLTTNELIWRNNWFSTKQGTEIYQKIDF